MVLLLVLCGNSCINCSDALDSNISISSCLLVLLLLNTAGPRCLILGLSCNYHYYHHHGILLYDDVVAGIITIMMSSCIARCFKRMVGDIIHRSKSIITLLIDDPSSPPPLSSNIVLIKSSI